MVMVVVVVVATFVAPRHPYTKQRRSHPAWWMWRASSAWSWLAASGSERTFLSASLFIRQPCLLVSPSLFLHVQTTGRSYPRRGAWEIEANEISRWPEWALTSASLRNYPFSRKLLSDSFRLLLPPRAVSQHGTKEFAAPGSDWWRRINCAPDPSRFRDFVGSHAFAINKSGSCLAWNSRLFRYIGNSANWDIIYVDV